MITPVTESSSPYENLEQMGVHELAKAMNAEDQKVALAVSQALPNIEKLIDIAWEKMALGGRIFYLGAGTSGRLGILDASEIPPTYGLPPDRVIGLIAGGDNAIRNAVEGAEDNTEQAWIDLEAHRINPQDILIGISASGNTPYVRGGLQAAQKQQITTGAIVCNTKSPIAAVADFPVEIIVGSELVTGSTRLKAGTAQKLVLNMISTCVMIKLGHVQGNKMVDMRLSNNKLWLRGTAIVADALGLDEKEALERLKRAGSVRAALANGREKR